MIVLDSEERWSHALQEVIGENAELHGKDLNHAAS